MLIEVGFLLIFLWLFFTFLNESQKEVGTPPGSVGLPIFGHLFRGNKSMTTFLNEFREKYGDIFWIKMGSWKMVIISDHEIIKDAFSNPAIAGRWRCYTTDIFKEGDARNGLMFNEGIAWNNVRRFSLRYLHDGGMGKSSMEVIIAREVESLVEDFSKNLGKPSSIPWSLNVAIFNVLWKLIADQRFEMDDKKVNILHKALTDNVETTQGIMMIFNMMPWTAKLIPEFVMTTFLGRKEYDEQMTLLITEMKNVVDEHKKLLDEDNPKDMIDAYLTELNKKIKNPQNKAELYSTFSETELVFLVFDLFLAGSETVSSTIRWFLIFMVKNPDIQRKVQEEIDRYIPKDRLPSLSDKPSLSYFEAAIHETMRCRTLLPVALFHKATEDTKVRNYFIPKGTLLVAHLESVHTDPKLWDKPEEFYPERFLNPDMTFNSKKLGLMPFSTGRRICMGESMARMQLFLMLSAVMQKFSFSSPEGEFISTEQRPDQPILVIPRISNIIINKR